MNFSKKEVKPIKKDKQSNNSLNKQRSNFISFDEQSDQFNIKLKNDENIFTFIDNQIGHQTNESFKKEIANKFSFKSSNTKDDLQENKSKENFDKKFSFKSSDTLKNIQTGHNSYENNNKKIIDSSNIFFTEFSVNSKSGSNFNPLSGTSKQILSHQFDKESLFEDFSKSKNEFFDNENIVIKDLEENQNKFASQRKINENHKHKRRHSNLDQLSKKYRTSINHPLIPENIPTQNNLNINNKNMQMVNKFNNQKIFTFNSISKGKQNSSQELKDYEK